MKNITFNEDGVDRTIKVEDLAAKLQAVYDTGDDTQMAVNTKQGGDYLRMDGYFMGATDAYGMPSTEVFSFQSQGDGEFYTVKFAEIVRTY